MGFSMEGQVTGRNWRNAMAGTIAAVVLGMAMPASAQMFSDGYKFLEAVDKKDGDTVTRLLDEPGSTVINSRDLATGRTALHIAAERRDTTWIRFLAERGANPNIADKKGVTPLMLASRLGHVEGVDALVKAGARIDDTDNTGETPLISAVHKRDLAMMRIFLRAGADPDRADNTGRSAREYARLLGADNAVLAEIERQDAEGGRTAAAEVYGPSL